MLCVSVISAKKKSDGELWSKPKQKGHRNIEGYMLVTGGIAILIHKVDINGNKGTENLRMYFSV
jgi:hypothetical protein